MTDPLEPITLPYLTTQNLVELEYWFAFTNNFSEQSFVAPYKFTGLQALSVESAITMQWGAVPWNEKQICIDILQNYRDSQVEANKDISDIKII